MFASVSNLRVYKATREVEKHRALYFIDPTEDTEYLIAHIKCMS